MKVVRDAHDNHPVKCLRVQHSGKSDRHLETLHSSETQRAAGSASVWPHIVSPQSQLEHVEGITLPAHCTISEQEVNI